MLHDLSVGYEEHVDGRDLDPLARGGDSLKLASMGTTHGYAGCYPLPFGELLRIS